MNNQDFFFHYTPAALTPDERTRDDLRRTRVYIPAPPTPAREVDPDFDYCNPFFLYETNLGKRTPETCDNPAKKNKE